MDKYSQIGTLSINLVLLIMIVAIVDFLLKGVTLWKSAQGKQKAWFVALLIINSAGILPIIYLLVNKKKN